MAKVNYKKAKDDLIHWINDFVGTYGNEDTKVVIGISGGKDSTVVAAACAEALGSSRVIGVMMPNGEQSDIDDSKRVCDILGIEALTCNIGKTYNTMVEDFVGKEANNKVKTNLPSRLRMATLYTIAATKNDGNCFVVNTSNLAEKLIGWGTLWGDTVGDFSPLGNMMVADVIGIGRELNLPENLIVKAPADGMTGKTDEEVLGYTYEDVDKAWNDFGSDLSLVRIFNNMSWKRALLSGLPCFEFSRDKYTKEV